MTDASEPSATETSAIPVGVIETDAFCEGCGFNLHTQKVWRDERLGIAVTRCPECGKVAAAGFRTTAARTWIRRAAIAGLLTWLALQLCFVVAVFFTVFGFLAAADEGLVASDHMTLDGRPVLYRSAGAVNTFEFSLGEDKPYNVPVGEVVYGKRLAPWLVGQETINSDRFVTAFEASMMAALFAIVIIAEGVMLAAMSWYWRRGMKWLWLLLPALATLLVVVVLTQEQRGNRTYTGVPYARNHVEVNLMLAVGGLLTVALAIGLAIGLPVSRLIVSIFIPPKARQLFAFLWHCDGKPVPGKPASRIVAP